MGKTVLIEKKKRKDIARQSALNITIEHVEGDIFDRKCYNALH